MENRHKEKTPQQKLSSDHFKYGELKWKELKRIMKLYSFTFEDCDRLNK